MSDIIHLDFETYCELDLKEVGAFRYCEHPSFEVLIMAIAYGDLEPVVWMPGRDNADNNQALSGLEDALASGLPVYAHNAQFEYAVMRSNWFGGLQVPDLDQMRCTAAMARRASIRSSLEDAATDLGIEKGKDKRGKDLIKMFSSPQKQGKLKGKRIMPEDEPEAFHEFIEYCKQDVRVERKVHKKLRNFELTGTALEAFQFDLRMNERGIPLNQEMLPRLDEMREDYKVRLTDEFKEKTKGVTINFPVTKIRKAPKTETYEDGFKPSQVEACKIHFKELGYPSDSLDKEHTMHFLNNRDQHDPKLVDLIEHRSLVNSSAVNKLPRMRAVCSEDGRARGQLLLWGAERTHRWAGRGMQPQNFPRPIVANTHGAYEALCDGASIEEIELIYGNFFDVLQSCMRHLIHAPGETMLQADYAAIEARIVQWLTGKNTKTLKLFAKGGKIYEDMAATIFNVPIEEVSTRYAAGDDFMRFVGKQAVLGCGFGAAAPKFQSMCESFGRDIGEDLAKQAVSKWREANPEIASYNQDSPGMWSQLDTASKELVRRNGFGVTHMIGRIKIGLVKLPAFPAFCMKLPSGHTLIYPHPSVEEVEKPWGRGTELTFYGRLPGESGQWGPVGTYGGKLLENATQAVAGDVMTHGALNADKAGYEAFMLVHDEILTMKKEGQSSDELCRLLCDLPAWADGLPIAAEGKEIPYYLK